MQELRKPSIKLESKYNNNTFESFLNQFYQLTSSQFESMMTWPVTEHFWIITIYNVPNRPSVRTADVFRGSKSAHNWSTSNCSNLQWCRRRFSRPLTDRAAALRTLRQKNMMAAPLNIDYFFHHGLQSIARTRRYRRTSSETSPARLPRNHFTSSHW